MATLVSWILGAALTAIGVAGFAMGSPLLGFFEVDMLHNSIHLVSGLAGLFCASRGTGYARMYLIVFGVVYGIVTVLGFVMDGSILGFMHVNIEDNFLHLVIAAAALGAGFGGKRRSSF